jgi:hypothetical protein
VSVHGACGFGVRNRKSYSLGSVIDNQASAVTGAVDIGDRPSFDDMITAQYNWPITGIETFDLSGQQSSVVQLEIID